MVIAAMKKPERKELVACELEPSVTELELLAAFSHLETVTSVSLVEDNLTNYAYITFVDRFSAAEALKRMDGFLLQGKPLRLCWSNRDPGDYSEGSGDTSYGDPVLYTSMKLLEDCDRSMNGDWNLIVKNLEEGVGGKELRDLFEKYGKVVSYKVVEDAEGKSKQFGFVEMDSENAANSAIEALNGKTWEGSMKKLYVSKFLKKSQRQSDPESADFSFAGKIEDMHFTETGKMLHVENFEDWIGANMLVALFSKFGTVKGIKLSATIEMASEEDADEAARSLDKKIILEGSEQEIKVTKMRAGPAVGVSKNDLFNTEKM